jgi:hypothetical protein
MPLRRSSCGPKRAGTSANPSATRIAHGGAYSTARQSHGQTIHNRCRTCSDWSRPVYDRGPGKIALSSGHRRVVNLKSKKYHFASYKNYGNTKQGAYMCEKQATGEGFIASKNEKRPGA